MSAMSAAARLAVGAALAARLALATDFALVSFAGDARYADAVCNDGSPAGYYWRASPTQSNVWIIFLEGGG